MSGFQHRTASAEWQRSTADRLAWPIAVLVIAALSLGAWLTVGLVAGLLFG
ncbi:hypothetical protein [Falsiroseomonas sp.]|uniref:hypothetical protein n=1 Tax=Falsiroseomonas sp. TaxID=2870721 RepID=UPI003569FD4A